MKHRISASAKLHSDAYSRKYTQSQNLTAARPERIPRVRHLLLPLSGYFLLKMTPLLNSGGDAGPRPSGDGWRLKHDVVRDHQRLRTDSSHQLLSPPHCPRRKTAPFSSSGVPPRGMRGSPEKARPRTEAGKRLPPCTECKDERVGYSLNPSEVPPCPRKD